MRQSQPCQQDRRHEIDLELALDRPWISAREQVRQAETRVVDQHVEAAEALNCRRDQPLRSVRFREVGRDDEGLSPRVVYGSTHLLESISAARGQDEAMP